jgi:hypothetical protein
LLTVYNDVNAFYSECAFLSRELCSVIFVAWFLSKQKKWCSSEDLAEPSG